MKKIVIMVVLFCVFVVGIVYVEEKVDLNDLCVMVLCFVGKFDGSSLVECDLMYKSFMLIRKKNKYGFLFDYMVDVRKKKLNECFVVDVGIVSKIILSFG